MQEVKVVETTSPELIKAVFLDPDLWESSMDDIEVDRATWNPPMGPGVKWLALTLDGKVVGVWSLVRLNAAMWQIHVAHLPETWGTGAARAVGPTALDKAFEVTGADKMYAMIPTNAKPVWQFAKAMGMKIEGTCKRCWKKAGKLLDAYHMGVYR